MSCICNSPVRPEFKDSYKDLLDKPSINGTTIDGNIETDNLGIKYPNLTNKPSINGVTLEGNLTSADLGIKAGAQFKIVPQLPVTDIDDATVYLVPVQVGQTDNIYQEWIYINNKWEKIGEPISVDTGSWKVEMTPSVTIRSSGYSVSLEYLNDLSAITGYPFKDNTSYICNLSAYSNRAIKVPQGVTVSGFYNWGGGTQPEGVMFSFAEPAYDSYLVFDRMDIFDGYISFIYPTLRYL